MYYPKKIKLLVILKEALSHGEEADGEDEVVVDGGGDVSADQQRTLP